MTTRESLVVQIMNQENKLAGMLNGLQGTASTSLIHSLANQVIEQTAKVNQMKKALEDYEVPQRIKRDEDN